ncbi:carboxyvinyl-carboxyphosphonate phosphorylmutase [Cupriavidus sp. TA19]|nr:MULTISPECIES: isocitrate lyase/PEP mutase family protein [unclassified Cupriavidus]BDB24180.1 isocitrate lyase/PEP mutase family protein [Cupriavidus sp. P-10]GLC93941.1 carboxyvinyl-carboxyphosphonate phosphorylmutase [Cupriavidus sp. TA19]
MTSTHPQTTTRPTMRELLARKRLIAAPGVFDMISVRIASRMGFDCLYMTGYGTVASYLGLPDAGLATYTDMVNRVGAFCSAATMPVICDGDTGYGGLLNVAHTVRGYERAGASVIQLEDQEFPKKCGHTPGRRVIPAEDMVKKIQVAVEARESKDFLILARTDARTSLGLDEALRRAEAYARAGADILFVESPESEKELEIIGKTFDLPLLVNVVETGRTPVLPAETLEQMGFAIAIYPAVGFLAAGKALEDVYGHVKANRTSLGIGDRLYDFPRFNTLMDFESVWDFDKRHAS